MKFNIDAEIEKTNIPKLEAMLGECPFPPFSYQWMTYRITAESIRDYKYPVVVKAAVSAGKTVMIAMVCKRARQLKWSVLIMSRQGEIIEQDHDEVRNFGVPNSVFSASLGRRSSHYPVIAGSEGTVVNALDGKLINFVPRVLLIDECHQVNVTDLVNSEQAEEDMSQMIEEGRSSATIIIRELQRRCREMYGRELIIIGYTGTDYRGTEAIINNDLKSPGFWREKIVDIDTPYLVKFGSVVPTYFGSAEGLGYDLDQFHSDGNEGDGDFGSADLVAMQEAILASGSMTQRIMDMMVKVTKHRNCVLVTCAGLKHCQEAAAALPEGVSYGIVTQETTKAERKRILKAAYENQCKFIFQVGCLTTGVNIPPWDTIVILRRIGSLTLLTQLVGRGMRQLKAYHREELGMSKEDCMVYDFAGTMEDLSDLYFSEFLEQYSHETAVRNGAVKECPKCSAENGKFARRCMNEDADSPDGRCEHFWKSRKCVDLVHPHLPNVVLSEGCGAENDIAARFCRLCNNTLIDPNKKLSGKAYTNDDYCNVINFRVNPTSNGEGIVFQYTLQDPDSEEQFKASEVFWPLDNGVGSKAAWKDGAVNKHIMVPNLRKEVLRAKNIGQIMALAHYFQKPDRVTHRRIDNGKRDAISRKVFSVELF